MFYAILFVLFLIVCAIFTLAESENRSLVTAVARTLDSLFAGIGAAVSTWALAQYLTSLFN
jgi:hypothetical protein